MSRSLQTLMIAREGVLAPEFSSIEAWLGRPGNTWEYYRVLARRGAHYVPGQDVSEEALDIAKTPMTLADPYPV